MPPPALQCRRRQSRLVALSNRSCRHCRRRRTSDKCADHQHVEVERMRAANCSLPLVGRGGGGGARGGPPGRPGCSYPPPPPPPPPPKGGRGKTRGRGKKERA